MKFGKISSKRMYEEIIEVVNKLNLSYEQRDFLDDIEEAALADGLSKDERSGLEDIYVIACNSPY